MSASKEFRPSQQQVAEALDKLTEWFPEEKTSLEKHRDAILQCILDSTTPGTNSPLLLQKATQPVEGLNLLQTPLPQTALPALSPCQEAILWVLVDAVFFALGLVGLHVSNKERVARALLRELGQDTLNGFLRAIKNFNEAEGALSKAKALFKIIGGIYKAGGFRAVFKVLKDEMTWWEWTKTGIIAVAQLTAWLASDGVAFVAEAALNIMSATSLIEAALKATKACS